MGTNYTCPGGNAERVEKGISQKARLKQRNSLYYPKDKQRLPRSPQTTSISHKASTKSPNFHPKIVFLDTFSVDTS